jgi:hypothetical protein
MRKLMVLAIAMLTAGVVGGATAPGASALTQVTCNGLNSVTYTPALTNTLKTTTIASASNWATCVSLTHPGIVAGSTSNSINGPASCTSVLGSFSDANTITWNTGQTSTFTFNGNVNQVNGQFVIALTGSITSGLFAGAVAVEATTLLGDLSACAGSGVAFNSGPSVLTIAGL